MNADSHVSLLIPHALFMYDKAVLGLTSNKKSANGWLDSIVAYRQSPWQIPTTSSMEIGIETGVLDCNRGPTYATPVAICGRMSNFQSAGDFGINSFNSKPAALPVIERSHSLLINDYGFATVFFQFRLELSDLGDHEVLERLVQIMTDREFYKHLEQEEYVKFVLDSAADEIDLTLSNLASRFPKKYRDELGAYVVRPDDGEDIPYWLKRRLVGPTWFDAGFPWAVVAGLKLDEDLINRMLLGNEGRISIKQPTKQSPFLFTGGEVGLIAQAFPDPDFEKRLPEILSRAQLDYYTVRQLQLRLQAELAGLSNTSDSARNSLSFLASGLLALSFERFSLNYQTFRDTSRRVVRPLVESIAASWNMDTSIEATSKTVSFLRNFLHDMHEDAQHKEARRQEIVLTTIAIVQVLALLSVLIDYLAFHGAKSGGTLPWPESGLLGTVVPVARVLFAAVCGVAIFLFVPKMFRWLADRVKPKFSEFRARRNRLRELPRAQYDFPIRIQVSDAHGSGLFTSRTVATDELIYQAPLGEEAQGRDRPTRENNYGGCAEWNVSTGDVYFVRNPSTFYGFINHSRTPNAKVKLDKREGVLRVYALRNINIGEEVLLDYRCEPLELGYIIDRGGYL